MLKQFTRRALTGAAAIAALTTVLATASVGTAQAATPSVSAAQSHGPLAVTPMATKIYDIAVYTGDLSGAGTDANVEIRLNGTLRSTSFMVLDNSDDNFERNQTDHFFIPLPDLGTLTSVDVRFDHSGLGPDWFLGSVTTDNVVFAEWQWLTSATTVHIV
jgi:hypothetical protein